MWDRGQAVGQGKRERAAGEGRGKGREGRGRGTGGERSKRRKVLGGARGSSLNREQGGGSAHNKGGHTNGLTARERPAKAGQQHGSEHNGRGRQLAGRGSRCLHGRPNPLSRQRSTQQRSPLAGDMALSKGIGASQQGAAHAPLVLCVGGRRQRGTLHRQQAAQRVNASRAEIGKGDVDGQRDDSGVFERGTKGGSMFTENLSRSRFPVASASSRAP